MKVMVLVRANKASEAGEMPSEALLPAMTAFNEELAEAGVLLANKWHSP
ncbi:MAG: YciI family protein [Devosia sp.]